MHLSLNHQPFMTELPELKFTFQTRPGMRHRSGNSWMCKDAKCGMSPQEIFICNYEARKEIY